MSDLGDSICGMSNDEVLFNLNHSKEFRLGGDGIAREVEDPVPVSRYLIAVMWNKKYGEPFRYSMRSHSEHGPDVSAIAKSFGGGGHPHAAAFSSEGCPMRYLLKRVRSLYPMRCVLKRTRLLYPESILFQLPMLN